MRKESESLAEPVVFDQPSHPPPQPPVHPPAEGNGSPLPPLPREPTSSLADQPWLLSLWRPLLVSVLSACLIVAFLAFVRRIAPGVPPSYTTLLFIVGLFAAALGCVSTTWLAQPAQRSKRSAGYRTAELVLILFMARVGIWAVTGSWPGFELILRPLETLLDGYFVVGAFAVLLAWIMATSMTKDLIGMALRPDDLYMARTYADRWQDTARPVYTDRPAILRRFTARWVIGGIFLVILAAGSRIALPEPGFFLPVMSQNVDRNVILSVIIYFLTGLVLISQGQLALLRARWTLQKTPSAPNVLRNWPFYALALIAVLGALAALLPLGGTYHLARLFTAIIAGIYMVFFGIFRFFLSLFLFLVGLLVGEETEEIMPTPEPPPQITPELPPQTPAEIPPWAGGAVFWIVAALLLGYAAYIYFSGKGFNFSWLRRLWEMLRERWSNVAVAYQQWQVNRVRGAAEDDAGAGVKRRRGLLSWLGFRNLNPDQQARYYYLAMLEQAEESGHPRRPSETPLRYAPRLAEEVAEQDADRLAIDALTEGFVRVRYARGHVQPDEASQLRQWWDHIKRLLRL